MEPTSTPSPSSDFFRLLVDRIYDGVLVIDQRGVIQYWNQAAESIFQVEWRATLGKQLIDQVIPVEDRPRAELWLRQHIERTDSPDDWQPVEFETLRPDGSRFWVDLRVGRIEWEDRPYLVAIVRDIDRQKRTTLALARAATTDFLSGLANRRQFQFALEQHIAEPIAVAFLDIDHFKSINDRFGHPAGDAAIRLVAEKLKEHFPDALCIARLGGEEFGLILPKGEAANKMVARLDDFRARLAQTPIRPDGTTLTISIGVAFSNTDAHPPRELLTRADRALYRAKSAGRNTVMADPLSARDPSDSH